jgi:uncharacterized SAM-binding protein YcdF (DUF218 family)
MTSRLAVAAFVLVAGFGGAGLLAFGAVVGASHVLAAEEPLAPADLIVVFAGDFPWRARHAADLFHRGYGSAIVTTGQWVADELCVLDLRVRSAELNAITLRAAGVPSDRIHVIPSGRSTAEEAEAVRGLVAERSAHRLIAVTSPYHVWRARWLLRRALADAGVEVQASGAPGPGGDRWWRTKAGLLHIVTETLKIGYQLLPAPLQGRVLLPPGSYLTDTGCPA